MGIVKNWVVKAGQKAGDKVATLSQLSPAQLSQVQILKDKYMSEMPDPANDPQAVELTARLMAENGVQIYNSYLSQIKQLYIPVDSMAEYGRPFEPNFNIRYFNITKWVTDTEENSIEKLVNVYAVLSNENCNIALVFNRVKTQTNVYLAVVNTLNAADNYDINSFASRVESAIRGNFPGAEIGVDGHGKPGEGRIPCLSRIKDSSVAIATNVPTEKSEKFISQTIEKLLDGIVPKNSQEDYTIILLATPVNDVEERKQELSRIYSGLFPYAQWSTNYTYTQTDSQTGTATIGVNVGASAGIQRGINETTTSSNSDTEQNSNSQTDSNTDTKTTNESVSQTNSKNETVTDSISDTVTDTVGQNESTAVAIGTNETITNTVGEGTNVTGTIGANQSVTSGVGVNSTTKIGSDLGLVSGNIGTSSHLDTTMGFSESLATGKTTSLSEALAKGTSEVNTTTQGKMTSYAVSAMTGHSTAQGVGTAIAKTAGSSAANSVGRALTSSTSRAITNGIAKAVGTANSTNFGANVGANFARSSSVTATIGKNEGITQNFANFEILHALEVLKEQMKRYETGTALGMWDFAAYVVSDDFNVANNVAHSYLALTQGEESYMSSCAVNLWRNDLDTEKDKAHEICEYLLDLRHPQFGLNPDITDKDKTFFVYPAAVTATATLSGKELAYSLNFPRKSIAGLPVFECAEFGRNVSTFDNIYDRLDSKIHLGNIFHMHNTEAAQVELSMNSLASHTFVTGSTGSGKSNTVCKIIEEVWRNGGKFLVIEPAKGEYKNLFGNDPEISVYGTNPKLMPLLKINPFSFPKSIHVLEHLDRLVEIFNVCWPMYAAMPAVLKNAIEKSYEDCGWNLETSENPYGEDLYPTFADVAKNIRKIIDSSEYDTENKGAYKGSLLTRLNSLTNGINGLIFRNDEIPAEQLFDQNVIVDLSRVGSSETKSLLMGVLVLKLQEYRMNNAVMNVPLRHVTVLEEAHNLLKRTSTEQSAEGANLLGKSVEMISNAIAEMRTYGEGFIIADQAPGLLDMAAIRNTNTKIIMRLPDLDDRKLVGKAASLNDNQITELAKLPRGVAAVYQSEWIQPVLCKIDKMKTAEEFYKYEMIQQEFTTDDYSERIYIASLLSKGMKIGKEISREDIIAHLRKLKISDAISVCIIRMLDNPPAEPNMKAIAPIMHELFPEITKSIKDAYTNEADVTEWTREANDLLLKYAIDDQVRRDIVQGSITYYMINETNNRASLENWILKGGFR
ncbi:MAG: helicase HerA domain-containing protein [Lachnospiraceae bacterium]